MDCVDFVDFMDYMDNLDFMDFMDLWTLWTEYLWTFLKYLYTRGNWFETDNVCSRADIALVCPTMKVIVSTKKTYGLR